MNRSQTVPIQKENLWCYLHQDAGKKAESPLFEENPGFERTGSLDYAGYQTQEEAAAERRHQGRLLFTN